MGLTVKLLANDLSIHGQFRDLYMFRDALRRLMAIRNVAKRYGREVHCHRNMAGVEVMPKVYMPRAVQGLSMEERRGVMQWITRHGPFWEDVRVHGPNDWLECNGEVVTDTAVGEAAYRCLNGIGTHLVSLLPSSWDFSPAVVKWRREATEDRQIEVVNYRAADELENALRVAPVEIASWEALANEAGTRYTHLTFSKNCFDPLNGHPFALTVAQHILRRLEVLERLKCCFDPEGKRTRAGHELYQKHFTGKHAWFSDSSDTEKRDFRKELTFPHPNGGKPLFCPWHGKVRGTPPIRIHFSWPVRADEPLYVVYVGPKITQR